MPITTYKDDYYDDFSVPYPDTPEGKTPNDKNYLRILFKPGYAVQVRELNQMQSMLQSQIDKFGTSIWKDGAAAIGGNVTFDNNISSITVVAPIGSAFLTDTIVKSISAVTNTTNNLSADVLGFTSADDVYTLYIRYKNSAGSASVFTKDTILSVTSTSNSANIGLTVNAAGSASGIFLNKGVFFTKGCFVATPAQSVFIPRISNANTNGFGKLEIIESKIAAEGANNDVTLLDNANGSINSKAPGADRYKIDLTLVFLTPVQESAAPPSGSAPKSYISLITIVDDKVVEVVRDRYTSLDRELAKRTFEESGNYALSPFKLELKECFKEDSDPYRLGRYVSTELRDVGLATNTPPTPTEINNAKDKYYIGVDPSIAYVDGFRVEPPDKTELNSGKARTAESFVNSNVYASIGNFCIGTLNAGSALPEITNFLKIYNIGIGTTNIGTTKIRAIETNGPNDYRIYLYDIVLTNGGNISDITFIKSQEATPLVNIAVTVPITQTNLNTNVFKLPYNAIDEVRANVEFNSLLYVSGTTTLNTININLGNDKTLIDTSPNSFIITVDGTVVVPSNISVGTTGNITITGTWAEDKNFTLIVQTQSILGQFAKTLSLDTVESKIAITNSTGNVFTLNNAQLFNNKFKVRYGTVDGPDVSSDFILFDDGQRDNFVTNVKLKYIGPKVLTNTDTFFFTYKYFANSATTGFATVNSYVLTGDNATRGLTYGNIPSYKGVRLSDVIDFRPVILVNAPAAIPFIALNPNSLIKSQSKYYLPKIDKVVVGSNNKISVVSGVPSLNPIEPETPLNTMALYVLEIPAYTYNVSDIVVNYINNRRYTMRDISLLDNRISNIEYYTTLSLLEKSANEKPISDVIETRFKNGIIVDSFIDFTSADVFNPAFKASIDINEGTLRPTFSTNRIDFKPVGTTGINANSASLSYDEESYIEQKFASESESVNPYDVAIFVGSLNLSPSSDEWQDTNRNVTNVFDPNTTNVELAKTLELGDIWDNWVVTETRVRKKRKRWWKKKKKRTVIVEQQRTGTNRTLELENVENETINDINLTIIPFIRSRKIYFSADNLKPNTRVYPFFDEFNVSEYVRNVENIVEFKSSTDVTVYTGKTPIQASFTSSPCVTNSAGAVNGEFLIPNNGDLKFKTGARQFKLTDHPSNNKNSETTYAYADYIAYGSTKTVDVTLTTTRTPKLIESNIKEILRNGKSVVYRDPIAQSFLIDNIRSSAGVFLSSVDLYFEKRSETLPVSICIVTMENGTPTQNIVPFSEVTLNPYALNINGSYNTDDELIKTSLDASELTKFTFSDLVYLNPGNEYALVVRSNDSEYRAYVSRVGGKNISTINNGQLINKNPYSGVFFMSANSSTWTPDQNRDLKFTLHRAKFNATTNEITFKPNISTGVQSVTIGSTPGSGYTGAPTVAFSAPGGTGNTTATGTAVINTVTGSVTSVIITAPGSGYTGAPTVTFSGGILGVGGTPASGATSTANMVNIPISTFNLSQNSIEPYATADLINTASATAIVNTLTFDASHGFTNVMPDENYDFDSTYGITLSNANAVNLKSVLTSSNDYVSPFIDLDTVSLLAVTNIIGTPQSLITGKVNEVRITAPGSGYTSDPTVTFSEPPSGGVLATGTANRTSNTVTSITITNPGSGYLAPPIISITGGSGANAAAVAVVDSELLADAGNGLSRYITRTVELNQPADRLTVFVDVNRPSAGSYIKVYVRLKSDDATNTWYEMIPKNGTNAAPQNGIPVSSDSLSFSEVEYTYKSNDDDFTAFAVKIVFVSDVIYTPTTVRNFRAIATSGIE